MDDAGQSSAARNRFGRLRLGICVTDTSRRNPAVTAQAAATLHLLTRGRAILGIGVGEREANEPYGVDMSRPVTRFEEGVATIRALWDSGGKLVSRDSPYFPLRDAVFALPPYRGRWPEIWIAAHGPRMLRATGRYADGWLPLMHGRPADYADALERVRSAASDAGREPMSVTPGLVPGIAHRADTRSGGRSAEFGGRQIDCARRPGGRVVTPRHRTPARCELLRRPGSHPPNAQQGGGPVVCRESPAIADGRNDPQRHAVRGPRPGRRMARPRCPLPGGLQWQCGTTASSRDRGVDIAIRENPSRFATAVSCRRATPSAHPYWDGAEQRSALTASIVPPPAGACE